MFGGWYSGALWLKFLFCWLSSGVFMLGLLHSDGPGFKAASRENQLILVDDARGPHRLAGPLAIRLPFLYLALLRNKIRRMIRCKHYFEGNT